MRKTKRNRTLKANRKPATPSKFIEVKTKSRAGVEYTHYVRVDAPLPVGLNYEARKKLNAQK